MRHRSPRPDPLVCIATKAGDKVVRVRREEAAKLIELGGWHYVPKNTYRAYVRKHANDQS